MKIKVEKKSLVKALGEASARASSKGQGALANVLISACAGGRITFVGGDGVATLRTALDGEVVDHGSVQVDAKRAFASARNLPDGEVEIAVDGAYAVMRVGRTKYRIPSMRGEDFPRNSLDDTSGAKWSVVDGAVMARMIDVVKHASGTDDARASICGVRIVGDGEKLVTTATDGHRLAESSSDHPGVVIDAMVPHRAMPSVAAVLCASERVKVAMTGARESRKLHICDDSAPGMPAIECVTMLPDTTFPDASKIVPKSYDPTVFPRTRMIDAIKRVQTMAPDAGDTFMMKLGNGSVSIHAEDSLKGQAEDGFEVPCDGVGFEIGLGAKYMIDALSVVPDDDVGIYMPGVLEPAVIRSSFDGIEFIAVVMPRRL